MSPKLQEACFLKRRRRVSTARRGVQIGLVNHQGRLNGSAPLLPPLKTHRVHQTEIRGTPRPVRTLLHRINPGESPPLVSHLFKASLLYSIRKNTDLFIFFYSKSHLNGCTPDFSKVKPRVNFPKVSYKPPKSRSRSKGASPSFRPPIGAESVKEDSRDIPIPGVPPATPDCAGGRGELGSPREATRLLTELEVRFQSESTT